MGWWQHQTERTRAWVRTITAVVAVVITLGGIGITLAQAVWQSERNAEALSQLQEDVRSLQRDVWGHPAYRERD